MVLIPYGLVAKSKRAPFLTILLVLGTVLYSFLNFPLIQEAENFYWNSESRITYAKAARRYVIFKCKTQQAKSFCGGIDQIPLKTYLYTQSNRPTLGKITNTPLLDYILEELDPKQLAQNSPKVLELQQAADRQLVNFSRGHQLLSVNDIEWFPILRSQIIHSNYWHLSACLLLLLFLAFPLEERLGLLFYPIVFIGSGAAGSVAQVYFFPSTFYSIGLTPAIAGLAGAYFILFLHNFSVILFSIFFVSNSRVTVPSSLYALGLGALTILAGGFDPIVTSPYLSLAVGFLSGVLLGGVFKILSSMPEGFTYSYEFKYLEQTKKNLSQYHRVKVLADWLYHCPLNMQAFREMATEATRSSTNTKVNGVLSRFREHAFREIYNLNHRKDDFYELLPLNWLIWIPVGQSVTFLENKANQYVDDRNFACAFKMNFLILNNVGWKDEDWTLELFKNYKRASVDKNFKAEAKALMKKHSGFAQIIKGRAGFEVTAV